MPLSFVRMAMVPPVKMIWMVFIMVSKKFERSTMGLAKKALFTQVK
jgi:hypothetical protein